MSEFTVIKSYDTSQFSIAIIQDGEGKYSIAYSTGDADEYTSWIEDWYTAEFMFQSKLQELEGN